MGSTLASNIRKPYLHTEVTVAKDKPSCHIIIRFGPKYEMLEWCRVLYSSSVFAQAIEVAVLLGF